MIPRALYSVNKLGNSLIENVEKRAIDNLNKFGDGANNQNPSNGGKRKKKQSIKKKRKSKKRKGK
jgi:hypothetical protein